MENDDLTREERAQFDRLPREIPPAPDLEHRVAEHLRREGAIGRARPVRVWRLAAAGVLLFAAGLATGRLTAGTAGRTGPPVEPASRYLLLLYGAASATPEVEAARVAEYGAWARAERTAGRMEAGHKLDSEAIVKGAATSAPADPGEPSGFFIIRAASLEDAAATAGRCPHVGHGGTVVVRRIE